MTIDGINFNKLPKNQKVNNSKEAPKGSSVEPEMSEAEKTALAKLRDSALAGYVLGLMKVAGGTAALGGMAASLQSCGDIENTQNQTVDVNLQPILDKLEAMIKLQQQTNAQLQQMYELMQQMDSDNKATMDLVKQLINQNKQITNILNDIGTDVSKIEAATIRIVALLEQANANDVEFLAKLDAIIAGQGTEAEKLDQILQANKEQNQLLINITKLIESIKETDEKLADTVNNFYNDYKNGDSSHSEMLENILNAIKNNGNISSDILKSINDLSKKLEAGQITESEMMAEIIKLLQSIDSKLDKLADAVDQIKTEFPDLGAKLDQFIEMYKAGKITDHALMSEILNELKSSNAGDADFKAQLDAILNAINNNQITTSEAMDKIIDILGKIEANTGAILDEVKKISGQIAQLDAKLENNQNVVLDGIKDLFAGVTDRLDKVISNQEQGNATLVEISDKIDKVNGNLNTIGDKILSKQEIQEMLGDLFEKLGDKIVGSQITVGDLEALLEAYKTDLTRTNALIETLVNLVANLDVNGDSEALKAIENAINAFKNQSAGNAEQVQAAIQEVLNKLAGMEGSLDALVKIANDIKGNQDKFMSSATTYGTRLMDEISKISSNMVSQSALNVYLDSYTEYLTKAEQSRQEQLAVLQSILANMDNGNGVDIDAILAKLPNYTDILNEISEKLGNVITSKDLESYIKTQPDLTRTNALIETLVNLVANIDVSGGGSGNNSEQLAIISSLVSEVKELIKNQKVPTPAQMQELIDAVNSLKDTSTTPSTRSAGGTYYHQAWKYN